MQCCFTISLVVDPTTAPMATSGYDSSPSPCVKEEV
ncbi:hypothetical protein ISN45_At05g037260 [Arabidopsis thaliana x Arabidopsis arenosa]|uniref:Uncharacterized protein n=2 Tax=Arabidopsis TaxID=3701 RepID=A0A8T2DHB9_ARASU|nr:hypothetical protein ISN45_At05g037260 [Arabidopsis thaliana x Arabidopsis arenosa]KAG7611588.1 hypothetical protein ISN44_As05g036810 [Arabidopsis suecica]